MLKAFFEWAAVFLCFSCLGSLDLGATPPPNDNFENRIVLESNHVEFSGTTEGATPQPMEPYPGRTVWWSWTAKENTPVCVQFWNVRVLPVSNRFDDYTYFNVYNPTNLTLGFPTNGEPAQFVARAVFRSDDPHPTLCFTAYAGQTYQLQLVSYNIEYDISLTATNNPLILAPPEPTTAGEQEAVLMTVVAVGIWPMAYQWQKGETLLAGANSPTMVFTNLSLADAGDYSVIVSNATGVSTSKVAHLNVTLSPTRPQLQALGLRETNRLAFVLNGEAGRHYRIESSTNLIEWQPESTLPHSSLFNATPITTSFVFATNGLAMLEVPPTSGKKFLRALRYSPPNEVCNVNLKQLRFLEHLWAIQMQKGRRDAPQDAEIFIPYKLPKPRCPEGGWYSLRPLDLGPACSIPGHVLEEPH